jgi:hypothetical protein
MQAACAKRACWAFGASSIAVRATVSSMQALQHLALSVGKQTSQVQVEHRESMFGACKKLAVCCVVPRQVGAWLCTQPWWGVSLHMLIGDRNMCLLQTTNRRIAYCFLTCGMPGLSAAVCAASALFTAAPRRSLLPRRPLRPIFPCSYGVRGFTAHDHQPIMLTSEN